jgi:large subunit ribosomal protein L35
MNKTKKALVKRFKVTKNGKILRRATGQNHYRSKRTGEKRRKGRKWITLSKNEARKLKKYFR